MSIHPGMFKTLGDQELVQYAQSGSPGFVMAIDELSNRKALRGAMQSPVSHSTVASQDAQRGFASGGLVEEPSWMDMIKAYLKGQEEAGKKASSSSLASGSGLGAALNTDAYIPTPEGGKSIDLGDIFSSGTPPNVPDLPSSGVIGANLNTDAYRVAPNYGMRAPYHPDIPLPPGPNITQFDLMMQGAQPPQMRAPWHPDIPSPIAQAQAQQAQQVQALQGQAPDYSGIPADYRAQAMQMADQAKWLALLQAGGRIASSSKTPGAAVGEGIQSGIGVYAQQMNDYQRALGDVMNADIQSAALTQRANESNLDRQQGAINLNAQLANSSSNLDKQIAAENARNKETNQARIEAAQIRGARKAGFKASDIISAKRLALDAANKLAETSGLVPGSPEYWATYNQVFEDTLKQMGSASPEEDSAGTIIEDLMDQ